MASTRIRLRFALLCVGVVLALVNIPVACASAPENVPSGGTPSDGTPSDGTPSDGTPTGRLQALAFLAGTWRGNSPKGIWESHYTSPEGGMILGTSKELIDGKARAFEFEIFHVEGDAVVVRPFPNGRRSVAFQLTAWDRAARKATFENPKHDFPQRIVYWRSADDTLTTRVGTPGKSGFELVLKRVD